MYMSVQASNRNEAPIQPSIIPPQPNPQNTTTRSSTHPLPTHHKPRKNNYNQNQVRVQAFHEHVGAVVGCYENVLVAVDGTQPKDRVLSDICSRVDKALSAKSKQGATTEAGRRLTALLTTGGSLGLLVAMDTALRQLFAAKALTFPSSLAGMLGLLALLLTTGPSQPWLPRLLQPGTEVLTKWLAVFFVPSLVLLPLALASGAFAGSVGLRLAAVTILGFEASLLFTARLAALLTSKSDKAVSPPLPLPSSGSIAPPAPAPFGATLHKGLAAATLLSAVASGLLTRQAATATAPTAVMVVLARTAFTTLATLLGYVTGARLPPKARKLVHPLITCAGLTLAALGLYGKAVGQTLTQQLEAYVTRSACPAHMGGGDLLLGLLGPSILAMAVQVYERRRLLQQNLTKVLGTCLGASAFGLFSSAALSRALGLPPTMAKATLSRCITTPLAMAVAGVVGADASVAVLVVVLTGLLGANVGGGRLASYLGGKGRDPVSRGLAMGASAHGVGTASLAEEPEPLAFSAVAMALTGVMTTVLVTLPPVRAALLALATGVAAGKAVLP
jgi:putative effector of murein hydrolase/putative effector of murein hydrolase LrgA (UPF0299 family)